MLVLQIISALLLLLNKYFVYKKKTIGWILGILGVTVVTVYFYCQMKLDPSLNLWIMIVYDIALFILMMYGYLVSSSQNNDSRKEFLKKWNLKFKSTVVSVTLITCVVLLINAITADLVFIQFFSTAGGLVATLLVAFNKRRTNILGWIIYFFTHLIAAYLMFETNSPYMAVGQILSALIAVLAILDEFKIKINVPLLNRL